MWQIFIQVTQRKTTVQVDKWWTDTGRKSKGGRGDPSHPSFSRNQALSFTVVQGRTDHHIDRLALPLPFVNLPRRNKGHGDPACNKSCLNPLLRIIYGRNIYTACMLYDPSPPCPDLWCVQVTAVYLFSWMKMWEGSLMTLTCKGRAIDSATQWWSVCHQ